MYKTWLYLKHSLTHVTHFRKYRWGREDISPSLCRCILCCTIKRFCNGLLFSPTFSHNKFCFDGSSSPTFFTQISATDITLLFIVHYLRSLLVTNFDSSNANKFDTSNIHLKLFFYCFVIFPVRVFKPSNNSLSLLLVIFKILKPLWQPWWHM